MKWDLNWRSKMRPTPKISVCLVAISVGLLLAFCNSARPESTDKAKADIKELQQKRLAVLQQASDGAKLLFKNARVEFAEVLPARRELFAARIEYADTREDRLKACDEAIEDARQMLEIVQARKAAARASAVSVWQAQAFELEAQIARAKAETSE
jgi:outer membrane protein TolC